MKNPEFPPVENRAAEEQELSEKDKEQVREARNILLEIIKEKNRARIPGGQKEMEKRERLIGEMSGYEKTLRRLLERLGYGDVNIRKIGNNLLEIPIAKPKNHPDLGEEYGFKGGQARAALLRELAIDPKASVRDVDIARIYDEDIHGRDDVIAQAYSPEDYNNGHGVEELERDYFESRDFTINEVLVADNKIYVTKECLLDTVRRIVRFSNFEKRSAKEPLENWPNGFFVNDKLMAKAVRLAAAEAVRGRRLEIADGEVYKNFPINDFHFALHLDRALEQGWDVAMEYIRDMSRRGQLFVESRFYENIENPEEYPADFFKKFIVDIRQRNTFLFRHAPSGMFEAEEKFFEELYRFVEQHQAASVVAKDPKYQAELKYGDIAEEFEKQLAKKHP
ncbi:MAG: hypothetical protein A3H70_05000 [Candidatus Komeilibacteria bacterium RIFCSPLOWO2_02_FULL_48_11]|uniref:Uncharacterized protein n=1 Tax=Candidatus Komeilibacteria bacterium RIFCSPLOWO2_02_FULL_48_11 TaxID=1798553 RepID=A0A1G2BWX4_9BACT|nr:MAG: hypothetical protein A3H70_05000 [Candidatus Komeilibacteria bacterium RIFCSPLOWO2_02_FULL_48_11]